MTTYNLKLFHTIVSTFYNLAALLLHAMFKQNSLLNVPTLYCLLSSPIHCMCNACTYRYIIPLYPTILHITYYTIYKYINNAIFILVSTWYIYCRCTNNTYFMCTLCILQSIVKKRKIITYNYSSTTLPAPSLMPLHKYYDLTAQIYSCYIQSIHTRHYRQI